MKKILISFLWIVLIFHYSLFSSQKMDNNCPKEITYYATSFPIDGIDWYVPIKYTTKGNLIDLVIVKNKNEELFIRFKISETLECNYKDNKNSNSKYKVLTYDEVTDSYGEKISEIEFKFSDGKGKIFIRHPNFPEIVCNATTELN